jgi:hypothetical protein
MLIGAQIALKEKQKCSGDEFHSLAAHFPAEEMKG